MPEMLSRLVVVWEHSNSEVVEADNLYKLDSLKVEAEVRALGEPNGLLGHAALNRLLRAHVPTRSFVSRQPPPQPLARRRDCLVH